MTLTYHEMFDDICSFEYQRQQKIVYNIVENQEILLRNKEDIATAPFTAPPHLPHLSIAPPESPWFITYPTINKLWCLCNKYTHFFLKFKLYSEYS